VQSCFRCAELRREAP